MASSHRCPTPCAGHPVGHGPADDVARRQLVDEALALGVAQQRPVAAQGLGQQAAGAWPGWCSAVGWNWKNSTSATGTPARSAMAIPSPVASGGLVVTA